MHYTQHIIWIVLITKMLVVPGISLYSQNLIINEFMSSNFNTIHDEDGDYEDWIEIYNAGSEVVDLDGYGLSDNSNNIGKWVFPQWNIYPGEYLIMWASGKDRKPDQGERMPGISRQMYRDIPGTSVSDLLNNPRFPNQPSFEETLGDFFEAPTNIADNYGQRLHGFIKPPVSGKYTFWIASDDNSHLLLSSDHNPENSVAIAEVPNWTNSREWHKYPEQKSNQIHLDAGKYYYISALMKEGLGGDNLAVRWQLPDNTIEEPIPASNVFLHELKLHTNFRISASGEPLILSDTNGNIIDIVGPVEVPTDISYGRFPDAGNEWDYFHKPSPGAQNLDHIFLGRSEIPVFSFSSGTYTNPISIEISVPGQESEIYYTLNSSEPTNQSTRYTGPVTVNQTTILRARSYSGDLQPSNVATATYLLNESSTFPIFTVTTDPYNLYDRHHGIFVWSNPYWESNLFQRWERPANIAFFEPDGTLGFSIDAGIRVHGGLTRHNPQKAIAVMARNGYGDDRIEYKIFENKQIESFKNIVLRASGNDVHWTMFRDCMIHSLIQGRMDLELSGCRPVVVFLNGDYWGIRNIREKTNEHYIAANGKIDDPDIIDQLEYAHTSSDVLFRNGSADRFNELIDFTTLNELSIRENYDYVATKIDIDNFIQYNVAQIYFDNSDWPGNNNKWWGTADQKWRWLLFDTDFGFGLTPFGNETGDGLLKYKHNTLKLATATDGASWPNPPHSTFLLRNLLKNEEFRYQFINTFADHLNTSFLPGRVDSIIDFYKSLYEPEIMRHRNLFPNPVSRSMNDWVRDINVLREFGNNRPAYLQQHIRDFFNIPRNISVTLDVNNYEYGYIRINSINVKKGMIALDTRFPWTKQTGEMSMDFPWSGLYFQGIPIDVEAIGLPGYTFSHWEGLPQGTAALAKIIPGNHINVKAHFVKVNEPQLLHYWHFNNLPDETLSIVESDYSAIGGALITYPGEGEGYMDRYNTGSSVNLHLQEQPGYAVRPRNPAHSRELMFVAPSTGFKNILVSFAVHRSNNGALQQAFYFSHDSGNTWTMVDEPYDISTEYSFVSLDLSSYEQANNNPDLKLKVMFLGENSMGTSGNNRFDNISITGNSIHTTGHTITSTSTPNGRITPLGNILIDTGSSQSFNIFPDPGYNILDVLVDGQSVGSLNTFEFIAVTADHDIHAVFGIETGISDEWHSNIEIWPNPINANLFLKLPFPITDSCLLTYDLFDFSGRLQLKGKIELQSMSIELNDLREGFYFLILSKNGNPIKKAKLLKR